MRRSNEYLLVIQDVWLRDVGYLSIEEADQSYLPNPLFVANFMVETQLIPLLQYLSSQ